MSRQLGWRGCRRELDIHYHNILCISPGLLQLRWLITGIKKKAFWNPLTENLFTTSLLTIHTIFTSVFKKRFCFTCLQHYNNELFFHLTYPFQSQAPNANSPIHSRRKWLSDVVRNNWRAPWKNGLSDDFEKSLLSCVLSASVSFQTFAK